MTSAIRDTLPLAIGIALNPIAIISSIFIANGSNPRRNGIALLLGWLLGLAALVFFPALLIQDRLPFLSDDDGTPDELYSLFRAALGVLLLIAAAASLLKGPLPGEQPTDPRWAHLLRGGGVGRKFALGAFLSIVNLKNPILLAAAASVIGEAYLEVSGVVVAAAIFVVIATLGILVPLLVHLIGGDASELTLRAWADWLSRNIGAVTGVTMALIGVILLTQGVLAVF